MPRRELPPSKSATPHAIKILPVKIPSLYVLPIKLPPHAQDERSKKIFREIVKRF